jgi:SAM-dependent methyltransferase
VSHAVNVEGNTTSRDTSLPWPPEFVRRRYNRLAPWYRAFEWILWLPQGIRDRAVRKLQLQHGDIVLEVGCGTGRNLPYFEAAVGPSGHVLGVDLSEGMLSRARALCERRSWNNVTLTRTDALDYRAPGPLDGVLFSLSYSVMQNRERILHHVWSQLRAGGRVVIVDGKTMPGIAGRLLRPLIVAEMKATVLGDPDHNACADLRTPTEDIHVEEDLFGTYFICQGRKRIWTCNRYVHDARLACERDVVPKLEVDTYFSENYRR